MFLLKVLLLAAPLAAASPFAAALEAQLSPSSTPAFCTSTPVMRRILSISSNNPHPSAFCAAVFGVPSKTVTTTVYSTTIPGPASTKFKKTITSTSTSYTSTSVSTVTETTFAECISGSSAGNVKRTASIASSSADRLSEACSCIGTHAGTITTTVTAATTGPASITKEVSTISTTVSAVFTSTTTVISGFKLQVFDFTKAEQSLGGSNPSLSGDYLDVVTELSSSGDSSESGGSSFGDGAIYGFPATTYALSPCNELVIIQNDDFTRSVGFALGQILANRAKHFTFSLAEEGFQTAQCEITDSMLTCIVGPDQFDVSFQHDAFLVDSASSSASNPYYASESYRVIYPN